MEQLPELGTAIASVVQPTFKIFVPLLNANASAIKATKRETFSYGAHPRQQLDVYSPSQDIGSAPVFVFLYGGGLVRGDKILPMIPDGLVHANIGHFLATNLGCIAIIPDYRLISHGAKFPSGGEDVDLVLKWIQDKFGLDDSKPRDLFIMANSAGGIHLSTWLYTSYFRDTVSSLVNGHGVHLRGVVMLSVPFHFRAAAPGRTADLEAYYGDKVEDLCPLGLLDTLVKEETGAALSLQVPVLVLNGTLDPEDEILKPKDDFLRSFKQALSSNQANVLRIEMMEGQNHISPPLSLGINCENEEKWGYQVRDWMLSINRAQT